MPNDWFPLRLLALRQTHQEGRPGSCLTPGVTFRLKRFADRQAFSKKQLQLELLAGTNQNTAATSVNPEALRARPHSGSLSSRRNRDVDCGRENACRRPRPHQPTVPRI